ncbi:hypothetical protein TIFTF001_027444 [Ficus carica]|uniref:Uncharacterized protein n=1 Tax=Ficus carica TaxID=3494 RepID=A0AA88J091_FICCA|nr:hypothetical protein TIFTF001_027444 [Ficus carica]
MIEVEELEKMTRMEQYNHSHQASSFSKSKRSNDLFDRRDRGRTEARSREDRSNRRGKGQRLLSPPKYALDISAEQLVMHLTGKDFVRWPEKITSPPKHRNMDLYYEFHRDHSHLTVDCKALHYKVAKLLKKGH